MKTFASMFPWENTRQLNRLVGYRKTFHEYTEAYNHKDSINLNVLRGVLITNAPKAEMALLGANVPHWMQYGSQAGGYNQVSITHELPQLVKNQFSVLGNSDDTLQKIDDMYIRAIGIYESNKLRAFLNLFNPFLYINIIVKLIFIPIFTIFDINPIQQETGVWKVLQTILRIPTYYITVVHPIIGLFGLSANEKVVIEQLLTYFHKFGF